MKTLFATFILIILSYTVIGQNNIEDVVYLKNGSIIRGLVLETIPNQTVKIQTVDRNIFVFQMSEVEKITKEEKPNTTAPNSSMSTETTDNRMEVAQAYMSNIISNESIGILKVITFTKMNAVEMNNFGVSFYKIDYKILVEFNNPGWVCGDPFTNTIFDDFKVAAKEPEKGIYGAGYNDFGEKVTAYSKGQQVEFFGNVNLELSENGWRGTDQEFLKYKVLVYTPNNPATSSENSNSNNTTIKSVEALKYSEIKVVLIFPDIFSEKEMNIAFGSKVIISEEQEYITNKIIEKITAINRLTLPKTTSKNEEIFKEITINVTDIALKTSNIKTGTETTHGYLYTYNVEFVVTNLENNTTKSYRYEYNGINILNAKTSKKLALETSADIMQNFLNNFIFQEFPIKINVLNISSENSKQIATKVSTNVPMYNLKNILFNVYENPVSENSTPIGSIKLIEINGNLCKVLEGSEDITTKLRDGKKLCALSVGVD
ncbi:MAG: hypothetical protein V9F05_13600 [Chitinophagaceae bacterium]